MALKKSLGQHLLIDNEVLHHIVDAIDELPNKHCLIEVGPGMGALTEHLMKLDYESKILIEKDDEFVIKLNNEYSDQTQLIIHDDVLGVDLKSLNISPITVVGNYPYNISNQIIFWILNYRDIVIQSVGMFQKEVAKRIASPHHTKDYGILSVLTQAFYNVEYLFDIPPESFDPPPKVMSGVIKMIKLDAPKAEFAPLKRVVKLAFNQRRKMLRNSLKGVEWKDDTLYNELSTKRPEQISVNEFCELSKNLK